MSRRSWVLGAGRALATRPDLWWTAVRTARIHVPDRWWTERPFLPLPDRRWLAFRYQTAFADEGGRPTPDQFVEYLEWERAWRLVGR